MCCTFREIKDQKMKTYQFSVMGLKHIHEMTKLYIQRQHQEIQSFPQLIHAITDEILIGKHFEHKIMSQSTMGIIAHDKNQFVGYLFAEIETSKSGKRFAWIPYEGVAIKQNESFELIRELYAKVAKQWVNEACYTHMGIIPLGDEKYLKAFQNLSFASEHAHAILDINAFEPFETSSSIHVRQAQKSDADVLGEMSSIITQYHQLSPVFVPYDQQILQTRKKAFMNLVNEEDVFVFLAEKDHQIIGYQDYESTSKSLMTPDFSIELSVAGTFAKFMGQGVGKELTNEAVKTLRTKGYHYIVTDWKITNIASSSFLPKCGFRSIAYKVCRHIR